ncbi:MAG: homoserine dehydrogenase [Oscillospiraceae bacterium]|nr:homoserine dehydrogenase [Oscillospiraceae bacterium]
MAKIAVLGYGTIGSGVVEVIAENAAVISKNAAEEISVKYIVDIREFPGDPFEKLIIKDFSIVLNDPEVSIAVETIGGTGIAYDFTKSCLLAGKSVVTSNKELVATKGDELLKIAEDKNVNYMFEASVGGGIPIIRPIIQCLAANVINEIYGILNGTTNYILTEMINSKTSFEDALRGAQAKGFAEQNPEADIEGKDACRKIAILSDLCFGRHVDPDDVKTEGIKGITPQDVEYAAAAGYKIKLLGRALRTGDGRITAYTAPHLISAAKLPANVDGVMNCVVVHGNALGEAMFYGAGAGKLPTAGAVVADVIDTVKHREKRKTIKWDDGFPGYVTDSDLLSSRFYVRARCAESNIKGLFSPGGAEFIGNKTAPDGVCAFLTKETGGAELKKILAGLDILSVFRVLD